MLYGHCTWCVVVAVGGGHVLSVVLVPAVPRPQEGCCQQCLEDFIPLFFVFARVVQVLEGWHLVGQHCMHPQAVMLLVLWLSSSYSLTSFVCLVSWAHCPVPCKVARTHTHHSRQAGPGACAYCFTVYGGGCRPHRPAAAPAMRVLYAVVVSYCWLRVCVMYGSGCKHHRPEWQLPALPCVCPVSDTCCLGSVRRASQPQKLLACCAEFGRVAQQSHGSRPPETHISDCAGAAPANMDQSTLAARWLDCALHSEAPDLAQAQLRRCLVHSASRC